MCPLPHYLTSNLQMDRSPLHIAAERGHTNVVEVLTEKFKSNVLARTKVGYHHYILTSHMCSYSIGL